MAEEATKKTVKKSTTKKKNTKKFEGVDIKPEIVLVGDSPIEEILLKDRTMGRNVIWATEDYKELGDGYAFDDEIQFDLIAGDNASIVKPRTAKTRSKQKERTKSHAEVFTPSWICNVQNNVVDDSWFDRKGSFNTTTEDEHEWTPSAKVDFSGLSADKTWENYVTENRMEITCGEAPYLTSRYDATTGDDIEISRRVGLLDRKLRVVKENVSCDDMDKLFEFATKAFKSIYGFEWQGDNIVIARHNLLDTFTDFWVDATGEQPSEEGLKKIATIISWNIFQMDGLEPKCGIIPGGDRYVYIMDWEKEEPQTFVSLIKTDE